MCYKIRFTCSSYIHPFSPLPRGAQSAATTRRTPPFAAPTRQGAERHDTCSPPRHVPDWQPLFPLPAVDGHVAGARRRPRGPGGWMPRAGLWRAQGGVPGLLPTGCPGPLGTRQRGTAGDAAACGARGGLPRVLQRPPPPARLAAPGRHVRVRKRHPGGPRRAGAGSTCVRTGGVGRRAGDSSGTVLRPQRWVFACTGCKQARAGTCQALCAAPQAREVCAAPASPALAPAQTALRAAASPTSGRSPMSMWPRATAPATLRSTRSTAERWCCASTGWTARACTRPTVRRGLAKLTRFWNATCPVLRPCRAGRCV